MMTVSRWATSLARTFAFAASALLALSIPPAAHAEQGEARSLDGRIQEIKADVLAIATELRQLEEKLLYPSDTQVAVFVSLAPEEKAQLDWVKVQIDGEVVAHHLYSFDESEALKKGGVQRLFTGNLTTGTHRVEVSVAGRRPGGGEFDGAKAFAIEKAIGPKLVEIALASAEFGNARIEIEED